MSRKEEFVNIARTWIDVPYKDKGRSRYGVDCIGLVIKSAHEVGWTDYDTLNYPRRPNPKDFLRELKNQLDRIPKSDISHGDIAVFAEPRHPCHTGIIDIDECGNVYVIHAYAPAKKVIREPMTSQRKERMVMAFRIPEEK